MKIIRTYIFCLDDHKSFSEDVKNRFSDPTKYFVEVTHNREDFMKSIRKEDEPGIYRIAIIGLYDSKDNMEYTESIISGIRESAPETAVLLITPQDKTEEIRDNSKLTADYFIPKNTNAILRIHNSVKKLISEHNLSLYSKRKKLSTLILVFFLIASAFFLLVARFVLPGYF